MSKIEHCKNPWKPSCQSQDIEVYILYKKHPTPICQNCWAQLAETDVDLTGEEK